MCLCGICGGVVLGRGRVTPDNGVGVLVIRVARCRGPDVGAPMCFLLSGFMALSRRTGGKYTLTRSRPEQVRDSQLIGLPRWGVRTYVKDFESDEPLRWR